MKDLFDPLIRSSTINKIKMMNPGFRPKWGVMSPPQAVCHLIDCLKMTFGENVFPIRKGFYTTKFGRWLVISSPVPWPKGKAKSPPEVLLTQPSESFDHDREKLIELVKRFSCGPDQKWGVSSVFGPLSPRAWARLSYRHINHHLKQFGV